MTQGVRFNLRPRTLDDLVRMMHAAGTIRRSDGPFRLSNLGSSHFYVEGRYEVTERPVFADTLLQPIFRHICQRGDPRFPVVIGVPHAGNQLATCLHGIHGGARSLIGSRLMRESEKATGSGKAVLPPPNHVEHWYCSIDNAVSSGESFLAWAKVVEGLGYQPREMHHYFLFDRELGGLERLADERFTVFAAYRITEVARKLVELKLWPEHYLDELHEEISQLHL